MNHTTYKLTCGTGSESGEKYFAADHANDAITCCAEKIVAYDHTNAVHAAWVRLERLPDRIYPDGMLLVAWTKTSDERPTFAGEDTLEATLI